MTTAKEMDRARFENAYFGLGRARRLIKVQAMLRVRQAIQRDGWMVDLLEPLAEQLSDVERALENAQALLGEVWSEREKEHWDKKEIRQ